MKDTKKAEEKPVLLRELSKLVEKCEATYEQRRVYQQVRMPGTGWMRGLRTAKFKPGIQRGQRFVEGSWLTPVVNDYS